MVGYRIGFFFSATALDVSHLIELIPADNTGQVGINGQCHGWPVRRGDKRAIQYQMDNSAA